MTDGGLQRKTIVIIVAVAITAVALLGCAGIGVAALIVTSRDKPPSVRTELTVRATGPDGSAVTDTTAIRRTLSGRAKAAGLSEVDVRDAGSGTIVIAAAGKGSGDILPTLLGAGHLRLRELLQEYPATAAASSEPTASPSPSPAPAGPTPTQAQVLAKFPATAAPLVRQASVEELLANPAVTAPFAVAGTLSPAEVAVLPAEWQYKIPQITCAALDARPAAATSVESESVAACEGATKQLLGPAELAGTDIDKANASRGAQGWQVDVELTAAGTQKFATLTSRLVQKRVAIVIDGTVASSPTIAAPITGGQVQISSSFTESDAKALAAVLGYGALDATLTVVQKNVITPD